MIIRGIVEKIITPYKVAVRIPLIDRVDTSNVYIKDSDLHTASICTLPRADINLMCGDVVIIGFENDDLGKPIILGYLYRADYAANGLDINLNSLEVVSTARLSSDTSIGNVTSTDIACLQGIGGNIQAQLDLINTRLAALEK